MKLWTRIVAKIALWVHFRQTVKNWPAIWWIRVKHTLRLEKTYAHPVIIELRNGVKINYGKQLEVFALPQINEIWHDRVYAPPGFAIGPADTVIDVGGNVGNFSVFAARQTKGPVYAFEPVPKNFQLLTDNAKLNNMPNIVPLQMAMADIDGEMELHASTVDTVHSLYVKNFAQLGSFKVKTVTLETFCRDRQINKIDFFKLDCEGAEYDIILKLSPEMLSRIHKIVMEQHDILTGRDHREMMAFLESHGFAVDAYDEVYVSAINRNFPS